MRSSAQYSYEVYAASPAINAKMDIIADKFHVFAFFFHGLWLIYHGAWRVGVPWLLGFGMIAAAGEALHIPLDMIAAAQLTMQLWIGFESQTLRALDARLRGMTLQTVVIAHDAAEAELLYYHDHALPQAHTA